MTLPMYSVPKVSRDAVRTKFGSEYKRAGKGRRGAPPLLLAIFGSGETDTFLQDDVGKVQIVPVRSELELRYRLPAFDEKPEPTAFLLPWSGELPEDLRGRFLGRGRIVPVTSEQQLVALTGAHGIGPGVEQSRLARYLLRADNPTHEYPSARSGVLTMDALWAVWLKHDWNLDTEAGLSADVLLGWAVREGRGGAFARAMREPAAADVRDELVSHLNKRVPDLGGLALLAWEAGRGEDLLAFGVLIEAFVSANVLDDPTVRVWLDLRFKAAFPVGKDLDRVVRALAEATAPALRWIQRNGAEGQELSRKVVDRADALIDDNIRAFMRFSHRLPTAWRLRADALGRALCDGAAGSAPGGVARARECLLDLERHDFLRTRKNDDNDLLVRRGEMAVRLLAWLDSDRSRLASKDLQAHDDAERLPQWYVSEGGYVDWARGVARGGGESVFGKGVQAVLERVDQEREALDRRFAVALLAWHAAARPAQGVVPIDRALAHFAVPFLKAGRDEGDERRLLVLLMDGMAWAQAMELLASMGERAHAWAPLEWHAVHRTGPAWVTPVLANLPTVTEVSRAAFFAGKPMPPGSRLDTQKDPELFANNTKLHPYCPTTDKPRLLLRGEGHEAHGGASEEALSLIRDRDRGVVGMVINAIDASLKSDTQQVSSWGVGSIRSLGDILDAAREAQRYVLLASDHGHVPGGRLAHLSSPTGAGARYRPQQQPGEAIQPEELSFRGDGVYVAKGATGVVLLTTDTRRYGAAPHAGEHGGATLAEVVAPCVLLGWHDSTVDIANRELRLIRAFEPDWWHFSVASVAATPKPPPSRPKPAPKAQLGLPGVPAQQTPATEAPTPPTPRVDPFAECEMLRARVGKKEERQRVARLVRFLLDKNGATDLDAFAQHFQIPAFRVASLISTFTEALNVDGYEVLRLDRINRQLFLDREKLETQFAVKGLL